jgi:hypothetical protein
VADATQHAGGELHKGLGWVKKHPYATAGAVFVGGAILIYLYYDSGSSGAAQPQQATGTDDTAALLNSELQAEAASNANNASLTALQDQLAAQQDSIAGNISLASIQGSTDLQLASINAQTLTDSINAAAGVATITGAQNLSLGLASIGALDFQTATESADFDTSSYLNAVTNQNQTNQLFNYLNTAGNEQAQETEQANNIIAGLSRGNTQ